MGVADCDNMLMLLGVSEKLTRRQRDVVTPMVIQGFIGKQIRTWFWNIFANLKKRGLVSASFLAT